MFPSCQNCICCNYCYYCYVLIHPIQADAYVNSTNPNLDLSQGAVSQALLRAGGRSLQNECTQKAPVHTGCVVVTGPGNLPCRHVLHTVIPGFKPGGQAEKVYFRLRYHNLYICEWTTVYNRCNSVCIYYQQSS